jgi:hypothetical protein
MSGGLGLVLALTSSVAFNWGWLAQHGAARELPALSARRPLHSLRVLFAAPAWLVGFLVGIAGWGLYVAALALAPLSLVQATSAGGVGLLAALAHRRGEGLTRVDWTAVALAVGGLVLIAVSLAGGTAGASRPSAAAFAAWLAVSAVVAVVAARSRPGIAAGTLYAAGDVATKAVLAGGGWLAAAPTVLAAHGGAFATLQLGFQRAGALETAGAASLLTNALPIVGGLALFGERLPGGALGIVRVTGFAVVVLAAMLLSRRRALETDLDDALGDDLGGTFELAQERVLVRPAREAHERLRSELA